MSSPSDKSASSKSIFSTQAIVIAGAVWALLALLLFLLGGVTTPGEDYPLWYQVGTAVFEVGAYLLATILCFRNWRSSQIVSGRNVWLGIGLGTLLYFIGGILFFYWETVLGQDAAVSPGDFFYLASYICLGWGMVSAVLTRRLSLEIWQWGIVAGIAAVGVLLAALVQSPVTDKKAESFWMAPAIAQTAPAQAPAQNQKPRPAPAVKPPQAKPAPARTAPAKPPAAQTPAATPAAPAPAAKPASPAATPATTIEKKNNAPEWVKALEAQLAPLEGFVTTFYIISDVVLLIIATILLLAFWGGRSSLPWRMIAAATFSLYIADIYFRYASRFPDYRSGGLPEVFWVFSGLLFGIGAILEYDLSTRTRRTSRRRAA